jgi:RimJ/RimL family protein N-acetyltransferase
MQTREQAEQFVERVIARELRRDATGFWAVERKADQVVAGTLLLMPLQGGERDEVEIGWHFHPDSWGQGLASESARALLTWGFEHGLDEILAVVRPGNAASMAVCRRIGMTHLGRTSTYYATELELFRINRPSTAEVATFVHI